MLAWNWPLLQSRELKLKGSLGTKVTPAAEVPCIIQHFTMSLALQEMLFLKSRWQTQNLWHFPHGLSYAACGILKFPHAQQCSSSPQEMFVKGQTMVNHDKHYPRPILHHSLSRREEASKGKSTDLQKPLGQGPVILISTCINGAVVPLCHNLLQPPGFLQCLGESPQR